MPVFSDDDIATFERAAARAWPAARTDTIAGWLWRGSGGGTRRANSVLPLGYDGSDLDAAIARIESLYREQATRSYFQVSSATTPSGLDDALAARGYLAEEPCLLMAKQLTPTAMPAGVSISTAPDAAWLNVYAELLDPVRRDAAPATLAGVPEPRAFLRLDRGGTPIATALGVVDPQSRTILVECVATRIGQRRTGAARTIMDALESWGASNGATVAVLQVTEANIAARQLYTQRGYQGVGHYHYRWKSV